MAEPWQDALQQFSDALAEQFATIDQTTADLDRRVKALEDGTTPPPATYRDPFGQPFTNNSFQNTPIGKGATYTTTADPRTKAVRSFGKGKINHTDWSYPVYIEDENSIPVTATEFNNNGQPTGQVEHIMLDGDAHPCGPNTTDRPLLSVQKDGTDVELYKFAWDDDNDVRSTRIEIVDIYGDGDGTGSRASSTPAISGLITQYDIERGKIEHTLTISAPDSLLKEGWIYPSRSEDANSETAYVGVLPMGTFLAIPPDIDVDDLDLTSEGKALAHALQDYGGYIMIRASTLCLFAEPNRVDATVVSALDAAWRLLIAYLVVVDGSTKENIGGPGERRVPYPPEIPPKP